MQRSPPLKQYSSSNPDLPELCGSHENTFVNLRKRKQPEDENIKPMLEDIEQKINSQLNTWKSHFDILIADSIKNSIGSIIDTEVKKITQTINRSFKEFGDRLDSLDKSLSYTMEKQDDIDARLKKVESQLSSSDDTCNQVTLLQNKIDAMEQQARLFNIEIVNLPERRDENLLSIVEKIGSVIKHPINKSDILSAHRVPHFDKECTRPKNVIIKFATKIYRDNVITASRITRALKSDQLGISGTVHNVYINEHLTNKNKQLFRLCREQAKKSNYKFTWVKHGTVLVRQSETTPIFAIRSDQDLKKIK